MGAVVISILTAGPLLAAPSGSARGSTGRRRRRPMPGEEPGRGLRRHAVILGYGRVGRSVARVLESRGFAWVAVESDYQVAREARAAGARGHLRRGRHAIGPRPGRRWRGARGHRGHPDALATRQAVVYARSRNPRIEIVARAHSEAEEADLRQLGAARVVVAERELGNELIRHALRRFGVSDREVAAILEYAAAES